MKLAHIRVAKLGIGADVGLEVDDVPRAIFNECQIDYAVQQLAVVELQHHGIFAMTPRRGSGAVHKRMCQGCFYRRARDIALFVRRTDRSRGDLDQSGDRFGSCVEFDVAQDRVDQGPVTPPAGAALANGEFHRDRNRIAGRSISRLAGDQDAILRRGATFERCGAVGLPLPIRGEAHSAVFGEHFFLTQAQPAIDIQFQLGRIPPNHFVVAMFRLDQSRA